MYTTCLPVLLGGDLNCYGLGRSFYEGLGVPVQAFAKEELGPVRHSRFVSCRAVPNLGNDATCLEILHEFARETGEIPRILLPCTDEYARFLITHKGELSEYITPVPPRAVLSLMDKSSFYRVCGRAGVLYPRTVALSHVPTWGEVREMGMALGYPYIIKPAVSDAYWHHPFPGMRKVYTVEAAGEAKEILARIFGAGYTGDVLCQTYIDGDAYTLTLYFDKDGRPVLTAAARILLEEMTPGGQGNYAACVSVPPPPVVGKLARLLAGLSYRGFANFDMRRGKDGRFYVLEVNLRPGRSNYFLTAAGVNPAHLLYRDLIGGERLAPRTAKKPVLFHTVPLSLVKRYTKNEKDVPLITRMTRAGQTVSLLYASADLRYNPRRTLYTAAHMWRERGKFRRFATPAR